MLVPGNTKALRTSLGFSGYYRRYVKDYFKIVKPLNDLLKGHSIIKGKTGKAKLPPWRWGNDESEAFETIKQNLMPPPSLPMPNLSFYIPMHPVMVKVLYFIKSRPMRREL